MKNDQVADLKPRELGVVLDVGDPSLEPEYDDDSVEAGLMRLSEMVVEYCERVRTTSENARSKYDFTNRQKRNRLRGRGKLATRVNRDGTVEPNTEDGHAEAGLQQGLSTQAIALVGNLFYRLLFENGQRPVVIQGKGRRTENKVLERALNAVVDDQIRRGGLKAAAYEWCLQTPERGTSILRYELAREGAVERYVDTLGASGLKEKMGEALARWGVWAPDDVYVDRLDRCRAQDQTSVFWVRKNITLAQLERDEAIYESDPETGELKRVAGKWSPAMMNRLRWASAFSSGGSSSDDSGVAASGPRGTLVEAEVWLPIPWFMEEGKRAGRPCVDYDIMERLGTVVEADPRPGDEAAERAWAAQIAKYYRVWQVAYLIDWQGGGEKIERVCLMFRPCPLKEPRNSGFVGGYRLSNGEWLRDSICDLGGTLEDAADQITNNAVAVDYFNSHPATLGMLEQAILKDGEDPQDAMDRLMTPNERVMLNRLAAGLKIGDLIQFMKLPESGTAGGLRQVLIQMFHRKTFAAGAVVGSETASETGTWSEAEANESKSLEILHGIARCMGEEICRMFRCLIQDLVWELGIEGFADYAAELSGLAASDISAAIQSRRGLENDVYFDCPLTQRMDQALIMRFVLDAVKTMPGVFGDPVQVVEYLFEGMDPRLAALLTNEDNMSPEDVQQQLRSGNRVDPKIFPDMRERIVFHLMRLEALKQGGLRAPEDETEAALTQDYVIRMMQMQAAWARMQAMEAMAPGGMPSGGAPGSAPSGARGPAAGPQGARRMAASEAAASEGRSREAARSARAPVEVADAAV